MTETVGPRVLAVPVATAAGVATSLDPSLVDREQGDEVSGLDDVDDEDADSGVHAERLEGGKGGAAANTEGYEVGDGGNGYGDTRMSYSGTNLII